MRRSLVLLFAFLLLAGCGDDCDSSPPPATTGLTVAQLNFLHGFSGDCPQSGNCRLEDRADLLFDWIRARGCPDVVTLQEVWTMSLPLLRARLADVCPFTYELLQGSVTFGIDDETVLSRYPASVMAQQPLFPGFRKLLFVRVEHPLGAIDVFTTHLASGSDGGPVPCGTSGCPAECLAAGAVVRRDCQAVQMAAFIAAQHDVLAPAVVAGDFNDEPGSFVYRQFTERGWDDVYLAAGNPECDPASGVGCTSGREDEALDDLESPTSRESERIDFIFLIPPGDGRSCELDTPDDRDGDGTGTRLFTAEPNPFTADCGAAPAPICFPSDHVGVEMDLNCR